MAYPSLLHSARRESSEEKGKLGKKVGSIQTMQKEKLW